MLHPRNADRRVFPAFTLVVVLALILSACQAAPTPTAAPPPPHPPPAQPTSPPPPPSPTSVPPTPEPEPGAPRQSIGEGEGEVFIISWAGYIERGETDPNYDWVTDFEAKTGCEVSNKVANTSDEMFALMAEGG